MKKVLKKAAMITDIHFGRKNNSEDHNKDCYNFIAWFCDQVKKDPSIDHIFFLGDWHEQRSAINGQTLDYSYKSAKMLDNLGMPIYMIIGNHDLYFRNQRSIYTTNPFESLENITLVDNPIVLENIHGSVLVCPYLFPEEYPKLLQYDKIPVVIGHFEFAGFVITGEHVVMKHGPDHNTLKNKKRVFSGHFHKRQVKGNTMFIGNTFPMDFADANDAERGITFYDFVTDEITHRAWPDAPNYIKCKLSDILEEDNNILKKRARVRCSVDIEISYSESIEIKDVLMKQYNLRDLFMEEETSDIQNSLENTVVNEDELVTESTNTIIKSMLEQIENDNIDNDLLIKIYEGKI